MTATAPAVPPGATEPDRRIGRLNRASSARPVEPDTHLPWGTLGAGQVIPDELLSIAGLDRVDGRPIALTEEQRARLSREEVAAMLTMGTHFEATLMAGFARQVAECRDLRDPPRHLHAPRDRRGGAPLRTFIRLVDALGPTAVNPMDRPALNFVVDRMARSVANTEALLLVMILAGEEIPDHLQLLAVEHPDTDPFLAALNRYHRMEEARHLSFAPRCCRRRGPAQGAVERWRIRNAAPVLIGQLWQMFVHPGVYATVGLPQWKTWNTVQKLPRRIELRHTVTRPVLDALLDAGACTRGAVPRPWQSLCGVDRNGVPVA